MILYIIVTPYLMQNRNNYTEIEHFLADESFRMWVYLNDDQQDWEEWTIENSSRAKLLEEARLWLLAMKAPDTNVTSIDVQSALEATWKKIENAEEKKKEKPVLTLLRKRWFNAAAAILVLSLLSGWLYEHSNLNKNSILSYNELINENEEGLVEQTNNSDKPQIITLSDGSSVLLQPNSKLSYPKIFVGNERKVYLSGEGFFEISKDAKKPFFVYANEIVTKVVGTSFKIKAYTNQPNVEVVVRTGKVKVRPNELISKSKDELIVLLPNQALRFVRKNLSFNKITDITQDESLSHSTSNIEQLGFEFTDIPVSQIFKTIEQAYIVKIDYPQTKLKDCYLTTSLSDQPLPEKLKIICKSLGNNTSYEMNGNQIIIMSDGCN
ncbi:FecR family protein [Flavobacterium succinicans]|uniref:FecR protein n=1 Tax=Flavobacterium succinicans TaxID=29536 RepID=A0A199XW03_9FLAO|nr:FecR family protein [Flavobacterium succinicans]OAZ05436.1 FecR protein [Flavobacterium succinicans]